MMYHQSEDNGSHGRRNLKLHPDRLLQYHRSVHGCLFRNKVSLYYQAEGSDQSGNGSKLNFITGSIDFFCEMNGIESIKFFEPVQMPPPAAEFSVCYIFQTVCHFLFYQ